MIKQMKLFIIYGFFFFVFFFFQNFYQIISSFTFQMLSQKSPITSPGHALLPTHSHFLVLEFPCTGAYQVCKTKGPLSPMMANQAIFCYICSQRHELWGLLVISYCCSTYMVADTFSSLGTFSSSSIGGPVFHTIDECEHPLLYLPGIGIASHKTAISGSLSQTNQTNQRAQGQYPN